ncbi:MAG: site-specific integrase [Alphaproteobacteria bacterium]|nr:site-specific integrase [Alphaproteobacteria bacterium]
MTKKTIDGFAFETSEKKDIRWDAEMSGFGVRIYPSGKKAFILSYRQHGKKRLLTIGQYGKITLDQAKDIARKRLGEVADGKDPLLARKAVKKKNVNTVEKVYREFLEKYAKRFNKHWKETHRIFQKDILPVIGKTPIDEVKRQDLVTILDDVMERGAGIMANRTLAALKRYFGWCVERGLIEYSPAIAIKRPARAKSRDRVLSDSEIVEVWGAVDEMHYPFSSIIKFLLITGQRRGEVSTMRWSDFDKKEKIWTIPQEFTKSNRRQEVPLSDAALEVLNSIINLGDYVFSSTGFRPFENFSRDKAELDARINKARAKRPPEMQPWTIHDLRRTVASGMARLKIAPHVIESVLNHKTGIISGVAAVYNRHDYFEEKREALDLWAKYVIELLEAKEEKSL